MVVNQDSNTHWFDEEDELPKKCRQVAHRAAKREAGKLRYGQQSFLDNPDFEDIKADANQIMRECCHSTASPEEAIRKFNKSRLQLMDRQSERVSAGPITQTNYSLRRISSIYGAAEKAYPNDPKMQELARQEMVSGLTPNMQDAWHAHHAIVVELNKPVGNSDSDLTHEDVIAAPSAIGSDGEVRSFVDNLLDDAGVTEELKLVASIWFDSDGLTPQRQVMERYNELTGSTRSLGWTNQRVAEIRQIIGSWADANRRLKNDEPIPPVC